MIDRARDYTIPFVLAVLLHSFALVSPVVFGFGNGDRNQEPVFKPRTISATLVILETTPQTAGLALQPSADPAPIAPLPVADDEQESPDTAEEMEQTEEEREALRQLRLEELRNQIFDQELLLESQELATSNMEAEGTTYVNAIYSAIVVKWSRPPSAKRDMEAVVLVELFPNGELNTASLVQSSGHDAFDRSTLAAVRSVKKFSVPQNSELFERRFRSFKLRFKGEDLLR